MLRRLYQLAALVALLNMTALTAAIGVLIGNGTLTAARLQRAVATVRGHDEAPMTEKPQTRTDPPSDQQPAAAPAVSVPPVHSAEDLEILRREAERYATELEQRRALTHGALLNVTTQRQQLEREREAFRVERESAIKRTVEAARDSEGFRKQVEIFDGLNPKVAMEHLLGLKDPVEAAMILSALETRKANKIVEAAKSSAQLQQMQDILRRIREISARESGASPATEAGS
jgi:hypothetical protein